MADYYQPVSRLFLLSMTQNLIPQILAITTPKSSPLRYLCIPFMIWIFSLVLHPVKNPSHITSLFATTAWFNILSALDHLLLNPKEADDFVAIREGTSKVKSFFNGLRTALKQHLNSRKINTPEEAKNTPPMPGYYTHGNGKNASKRISRHRYLIRETAIAMWQYLVLDISTSQAVKTGLSKNEQQQQQQNTSVEGSWVELCIEQIIVAVAAWFIVGRIVISFTYRLVAVVSVGLRFEAPEEYPPLFSKMADAYTLRNFWGWVALSSLSFLERKKKYIYIIYHVVYILTPI